MHYLFWPLCVDYSTTLEGNGRSVGYNMDNKKGLYRFAQDGIKGPVQTLIKGAGM